MGRVALLVSMPAHPVRMPAALLVSAALILLQRHMFGMGCDVNVDELYDSQDITQTPC